VSLPSEQLPAAEDVVALPVEDLAVRLLRFAVNDQQGHLLSRSNALAPVYWPKQGSDQAFLRAIGEAWDWLRFRGLIAIKDSGSDWTYVTKRGERVVAEQDPVAFVRAEARIAVDLHERLRDRIPRQFVLGEYELAAFAAMREVEIRLRQLAGADEGDIGVNLAKQALKPGGPLADPNLETGEQEATMALFWGALGVFKNPPSHRQVEYGDPTLASEVVLLADLLLRLLDLVGARIPARSASV
jgi:uncharacterized protein (TIGR02391 family)